MAQATPSPLLRVGVRQPPVIRTVPLTGLRQPTATPLFGPGCTETDFGGSLKVETTTSWSVAVGNDVGAVRLAAPGADAGLTGHVADRLRQQLVVAAAEVVDPLPQGEGVQPFAGRELGEGRAGSSPAACWYSHAAVRYFAVSDNCDFAKS